MKGMVGAVVSAVAIIGIIVGLFVCTEKIPAGYVGVVYNMNGGVEDEVLTQGFRVVAPTKKVTLYSIALEQSYMTDGDQGDSPDDESFEIPTKEGASLDVDVAFSYSFELTEVPQTFTRFRGQSGKEILKFELTEVPQTFTRFRGQSGKEILKSFIKPKMQAWIKEITPDFAMIDIVSKQRGMVNATLTEKLKERFAKYGIVIDNVALADVRPDEETDKAIKEKIKAQEALETAKVTAEKDKVEANRDKEVAEINAEKAKIEAQGEADARKIEAEGEAAANKMISDSLSDKLIENKKIDKWKGDVPKVQGSNATIVDVGALEE